MGESFYDQRGGISRFCTLTTSPIVCFAGRDQNVIPFRHRHGATPVCKMCLLGASRTKRGDSNVRPLLAIDLMKAVAFWQVVRMKKSVTQKYRVGFH